MLKIRVVKEMLRVTAAAAISLLVAFSASAQTVRYVHTDGLGSVVLITDKDRNIVERSEYEPYGNLLNRPLTDGPGYTGHVMDAATRLSYMQQRYYDPGIGVFISVDPISASENPFKGFNRYLYGNGNPYTFTDPDGRQSWNEFEKGFGDGARNANYGEHGFPYKANWSEQAGYAIGAGIVKGGQSHGGIRIPAMRMRAGMIPQKRGPKTDPSAPHNATIREEANRLESEGNLIIAGGGRKPERLIPTPDGTKSGRRPDILYQTPEGEVKATNVGLTYADGSPVKREVQAIDDLNNAGVKTNFKPYDK